MFQLLLIFEILLLWVYGYHDIASCELLGESDMCADGNFIEDMPVAWVMANKRLLEALENSLSEDTSSSSSLSVGESDENERFASSDDNIFTDLAE